MITLREASGGQKQVSADNPLPVASYNSPLGSSDSIVFDAQDEELILPVGGHQSLGLVMTPDEDWVSNGSYCELYLSMDGGDTWTDGYAWEFNDTSSFRPYRWPRTPILPRSTGLTGGVTYHLVVPLYGGITHAKVKATTVLGGTCECLMRAVDTAPGYPLTVTVDDQNRPGRVKVSVGSDGDDLGKAEDAAHASGHVGVMALAVRKDTAQALAGTDGDYIPLITDSSGQLHTRAKDAGPAWTPVRSLKSTSDATSASDLTAAPTSGQKIVLDDIWVSVDTAMRVDLLEETSGTVLWSVYLPANGSVQFTPRDGLKLDTADKKVRIQSSATGNLRCITLHHSEA